MKLLNIIHEDFVNYQKPSMVLEFPKCSFKCNKDCGELVCQNMHLTESDTIDISVNKVIKEYLDNPLTQAIVMQGLEPFDSFGDVYDFVSSFRKVSRDDIVIYTGYTKHECIHRIRKLQPFNNIIIKLGRFVPNQEPHFDAVLGVKLASDNQYGQRIEEF